MPPLEKKLYNLRFPPTPQKKKEFTFECQMQTQQKLLGKQLVSIGPENSLNF